MDSVEPGDSMEYSGMEPAEQAATVMTAAGMPRMPARVMMALIAAPEGGYTAAELSERLGISAGAVSGAVRYLLTTHFILRRSVPGHRRDRYDLAADTWHSVLINNSPVYERMADYIDRIGASVTDDAAPAARASDMAAFLRFMARRIPQLVAEWEEQRDADTASPG
jgi:DNA-binding transcriptional regulator GbsR (MarR family)